MKYITFEKLALKLEGRLKIVEIQDSPMFPDQSLFQEVKPEVVELIAEEQESYMDLILGQIYQLPFQLEHPILSSISADLIIAQLLMVHFQGSGLANIGHDLSNLGKSTQADALDKLQMLTIGYQVYLPNQQLVTKYPGGQEYRRIVLEGEKLRDVVPSQIPVNNETIVIKTGLSYNAKANPFGDSYDQRWRD